MPGFSILRGLRVSTVMMALVIIALVLALIVEQRNDRKWREIAKIHRKQAKIYESYHFYHRMEYGLYRNALDRAGIGSDQVRAFSDKARDHLLKANHYAELEHRYRDASYAPWEPLEQDPNRSQALRKPMERAPAPSIRTWWRVDAPSTPLAVPRSGSSSY